MELKTNLVSILGAQKAGTTTLFDILARHPQIEPCTRKEPAYFNYTKKYSPELSHYLSWFANPERPYLLDATPGYLYGISVPQRIAQMFPHAKLIILLRDPIERAFSAWNMFRTMNSTDPFSIWSEYFEDANAEVQESMRPLLFAEQFPDFQTLIDIEMSIISSASPMPEPSIIRRGLYAEQIARFMHFFSNDQFFIADQYSFFSDLKESLRRLSRFLNIDTDLFPYTTREANAVLNKGDYGLATGPDPVTLNKLREYFENDKRTLTEKILPKINSEFLIYPSQSRIGGGL